MARLKQSTRVNKPRASATGRTTRQRSKLTTPSSASASATAFWDMVEDNTDETAHAAHASEGAKADMEGSSVQQDKGKGKLAEIVQQEDEEKVFPLMQLPTEIRLEIYRACLTRPYNILLSKVERGQATGGGAAESEETHTEEQEAAAHYYASSRETRSRTWMAQRESSRLRDLARNAEPIASLSHSDSASSSNSAGPSTPSAGPRNNRRAVKTAAPKRRNVASPEDPLLVNILRVSKDVYKEARGVLYTENVFDLDISTAVNTLAALHQRSRRHIKHVELVVPTYTEILERFSEIVRLSLRYCTGLKRFVISTPFTLPGADGGMASSNTTVYANGFDILRWLPQQCEVVMNGNKNAEIEAVVAKHLTLAKTQNKLAYARRQLISNDSSTGDRELEI